jgi:hypothetical protein
MRVDSNHIQGNRGVAGVNKIVSDMGWIFREQPTSDIGIDAHLEIVESGESSGQLIALQIKSGSTYLKKNKQGDYPFYFESEYRNYWLSYSLPVILVLYDTDQEIAYWQSLDIDSIKETSKNRYKVIVPSRNRLDKKGSHIIFNKYFGKFSRLVRRARKNWVEFEFLLEPEQIAYLAKNINPQDISKEDIAFILCCAYLKREHVEEWMESNEKFSLKYLFDYLRSNGSVLGRHSDKDFDLDFLELGSGTYCDYGVKIITCLLFNMEHEGVLIFVKNSSITIRAIPPGNLRAAWHKFEEGITSRHTG